MIFSGNIDLLLNQLNDIWNNINSLIINENNKIILFIKWYICWEFYIVNCRFIVSLRLFSVVYEGK
jgi:hypothetical protein